MKTLILYDQNCYLCKQSKKIIKWIDWFRVFKWESLQDYQKRVNLAEKDKKALEGEIHVKRPDGKLLKGFYAVRYILLRCVLTSWLGLLAYLPYTDRIGNPLYRFIARNRYRFFKNKCKKGTCRIH
ncbi:thiol-disulfide oxidoreductase DCC family protein [Paraliobacillus sp. JSM ZJ581]|uniref:thiol-disulfide oxidoreductase DCC family protein n=1 Tax=Paraliobacillus sp. JSM ZJ581 TaxID=3342118 RepID=UPI0035A90592